MCVRARACVLYVVAGELSEPPNVLRTRRDAVLAPKRARAQTARRYFGNRAPINNRRCYGGERRW